MKEDLEQEIASNLPKKRFRFTIRVGILTFFISTFLTFSLAILLIISYSFYNNSLTLTKQIIQAISTSVLQQVSSQLNPAQSTSRLSGEIIQTKVLEHNSINQMMSYTLNTLDILPQAQMAYWGDENGNFIISRREPDDTLSSEIINYRGEKAERKYIYRDKSGKVTVVKPIANFDYDPRKRPWYVIAKENQKTVWSSAYLFYSGKDKTLGITSATPSYIDGKLVGVFGIDVKLESISRFLSQQRISDNGEAFIVNNEGKVIASPDYGTQLKKVSEVGNPGLARAYQLASKMKDSTINYSANGVKYVSSTYAIPGFEIYGWKIFILLPEDDITGPVKEANIKTLLLCALLLMFGLLIISIFAKRLAVPIKMLAKDVERVKMFNIKTQSMIDSRIQEVYDMSSAIHAMKVGLQSFQKYVPQQLVRKLISSGEAAKLGGRSRQITLLFSDIDDFTRISETIGDQETMLQMCDYFDVFDENIQDTSGTVDKFIGDAIMAFWGAPEADELQIFHACSCAVSCQKAIAHQNDKWVSENKMPFPTRIGIHTGEVLVGNMGSRNRLNYTAIGDTVNITSRLEQLNKIYLTKTITSHEAQELVKDQFIFRKLDQVIVKGRIKALTIYELIDNKNIETEHQYGKLCEEFEVAWNHYAKKEWDAAISIFKALLKSHPDDGPCKLFIDRCNYFKDNPNDVAADWDGTWLYTQK